MRPCRLLILFIALSLALPVHIGAQSKSKQDKNVESKREQQAKLQGDIKFLDKQIQQTQKSHSNTITELRLIQKKAETRKKLIDKIAEQIESQQKEIDIRTLAIDSIQKIIDTLSTAYKKTIYKAYQNRDSRLWFIHILASSSIEQGYRRWAYLKNYTRSLNTQATILKNYIGKVEEEKRELSELKETNQKEQSEKNRELEQLRKDEISTQKKASELAKQQSALKKELQQKKQQAERLDKEIQKMIASALKKTAPAKKSDAKPSNKKDSFAATPESLKLSAEFEGNKGKLPWPVKQGVVIENFGENPHPTLKGVKLPFNNGINISSPRGSGVLSVFNGVVKQIIYIPGYNNCVLVSHGKYFTFYCKLAKVNVKANQKITTGQLIGNLESTSATSELHFEIWNGTQKQNPNNWLKQR